MRGIADTTKGAGLLRAHAVRTTVNQAALFGSPFIGLLLFRLGGVDAVLIGICVLQAVALLLLVPVPRIGGGYERGRDIDALARAFDSVRTNPRLRRIGLANLIWNVFAGSALGILPAVLREHLGLDEVTASAAFIAGMVVVVVLTLPVTRGVQRRMGPFPAFLAASAVQGAALLLFVPSSLAVVAPLLVSAFLLSNSTAAASLNGARAARDREGPAGAPQHHRDDPRDDRVRPRARLRRGPARRHQLRPRPRSHRRRDGGHGRRLPSPGHRDMTLDLLIHGATVVPGDGPPFTADVSVAGGRIVAVEPLATFRHEGGFAGCRRDGRRDGVAALPGVRRPPRALGALAVRRPAAGAEDRAGLHDRGDLPGRARAGAGLARSLARPARLPPRSRRAGPGRVGVADRRGVPRRARRDATGDVPRPVGGARRDPRPRRRLCRRRSDGVAAARDARPRARRDRRRRPHALLRSRLPARRARAARRAGRRLRGGGRGRHPDRPARPERGRRAARRDRRDARRRTPLRRAAPRLPPEGARRRADDPAAPRAARRGEQ